MKVASEPEALLAVLANPAYHFKRIGLEAGPLSQWLYSVLDAERSMEQSSWNSPAFLVFTQLPRDYQTV